MVRLLIITLLLTGCATDHRRAHVAAVRDLTQKGYDLTNINVSPKIITINRGWYNPETKCIIIEKTASHAVLKHEIEHYILHQLGIDISEHHKRME